MTGTPTRILLVEDNRAEAILLQDTLMGATGGAFELIRADRMDTALAQLTQGGFDAILLDLTLPDSRGLATLERIQKVARGIPTVILTGIEDEELAVSAIRNGAQDYMVKGTVDGRAIAKAIRFAIDRKKTEDALRESEAAYMAAKASVDTVNAMEEGVALVNMDGTVRSVNPALVRLTEYPREQLEGMNVADLLPRLTDPVDLAQARSALNSAMRGETHEFREVTMVSRTAKRIPIILRAAFIKDDEGRPVTIVFTMRDMSEHRKAQRQQQIVTAVLALFAKKTSRKEYLDAVVRVLHHWSGCRCIGTRVLMVNGTIPYESYVGFPDEFVASESALTLGKDECVCTRVIMGKPEPQDNACITPAGSFSCGNTREFVGKLMAREQVRFRGVCVNAGFASVVVVPVRHHEDIVGALHFADEREGVFTPEMVAFVESTISPLMGEAIHRFDMETELRALSLGLTLAEERARRQLAIALHDTVGQILSLVKIKLGALGQMVSAKEQKLALAEIREMFDGAVRQTRTLCFELSPPILYELGLCAAVEWLGEEFARQNGVKVSLDSSGVKSSITESVSVLFFQSARELLTNVAKHAAATAVRISLHENGGQIVMKIADNGRGMAHNPSVGAIGWKNCLGLFSIRERMRHIGGRFEIESQEGQGTTVTLSAPLGGG